MLSSLPLNLFCTVLFTLGLFSPLLNVLQTLNGVYCFSKVVVPNEIVDDNVRSISVSGFHSNHNYDIKSACFGNLLDSEPEWSCQRRLPLVMCKQNITIRSVEHSYSFIANCYENKTEHGDYAFSASISPGSSLLTSSPGKDSYKVIIKTESSYCQLNRKFYATFFSSYVGFTLVLLLCCVLLKLLLLSLTWGLYFHWTFNQILKFLCSKGMVTFCSPWKNLPVFCKERYAPSFISSDRDFYQFEFHDGSRNYIAFESPNKSGESHFISEDNQGLFKASTKAGEDGLRKFILHYLILKSEGKCVCHDHHYPNLEEVLVLYKRGFRSFEIVESDKIDVVLGKFSVDSDDLLIYKKHFYRFWGFYNRTIFENVFKGNKIKPCFESIKNTEWKVYLSDLFIHYGVKPHYKVKVFKKSSSFIEPGSEDEAKFTLPRVKFHESLVPVEAGSTTEVKNKREGKAKSRGKEGEDSVVKDKEAEMERMIKENSRALDLYHGFVENFSGEPKGEDGKILLKIHPLMSQTTSYYSCALFEGFDPIDHLSYLRYKGHFLRKDQLRLLDPNYYSSLKVFSGFFSYPKCILADENDCLRYSSEIEPFVTEVNDFFAKSYLKYSSSVGSLEEMEKDIEVCKGRIELREGKTKVTNKVKKEIEELKSRIEVKTLGIQEGKEFKFSFEEKLKEFKKRIRSNETLLKESERLLLKNKSIFFCQKSPANRKRFFPRSEWLNFIKGKVDSSVFEGVIEKQCSAPRITGWHKYELDIGGRKYKCIDKRSKVLSKLKKLLSSCYKKVCGNPKPWIIPITLTFFKYCAAENALEKGQIRGKEINDIMRNVLIYHITKGGALEQAFDLKGASIDREEVKRVMMGLGQEQPN